MSSSCPETVHLHLLIRNYWLETAHKNKERPRGSTSQLKKNKEFKNALTRGSGTIVPLLQTGKLKSAKRNAPGTGGAVTKGAPKLTKKYSFANPGSLSNPKQDQFLFYEEFRDATIYGLIAKDKEKYLKDMKKANKKYIE